jgi:hypothetical protein
MRPMDALKQFSDEPDRAHRRGHWFPIVPLSAAGPAAAFIVLMDPLTFEEDGG